MVLNQQLTKEDSLDFYNRIAEIRDGWLPFVTNYCELKEKGWYEKYDRSNQHVSEIIKDDEEPYTKQYHHAWSTCPVKNEIIALIKSCSYLKTDEALKVFEEITGISTSQTDDKTEEAIQPLREQGYKIVKD